MPAVPLSNFHEAVRILAGDGGDLATGYDFTDAQIDAALRTALLTGGVPGLEISAGNPSVLSSGPRNADTFAWLAVSAALLLVGGPVPVSVRTRALSVQVEASGRRDTLSFLESRLSDIDARGNVGGTEADTDHKGLFATVADFMTTCRPPCGAEELASADCCISP